MNIAVIGNGGREDALLWILSKDNAIKNIYSIPGNGGSLLKHKVQVLPFEMNEYNKIIDSCLKNNIDYVIIGPEKPLADGLADILRKNRIQVIGPNLNGARLEADKAFAKMFMKKYSIPTASYEIFTDFGKAVNYLQKHGKKQYVIKASGLAAGKGVIIPENLKQSLKAIDDIMNKKIFGNAGEKIVIEEFLEGVEISYIIATNGSHYCTFPLSRDYKRALNNNKGLNTGGMGGYAPNSVLSEHDQRYVKSRILVPTLNGLKNEGIDYSGFLYFGLMKTNDGIYVIEYNCRLGDPETEITFPLIQTPFSDILKVISSSSLNDCSFEILKECSVAVVIAAKGYPEKYKKNIDVTSIFELNRDKFPDIILFHNGTKFVNGKVKSNGGRIFTCVKKAASIEEAQNRIYEFCRYIKNNNVYFRMDIATSR